MGHQNRWFGVLVSLFMAICSCSADADVEDTEPHQAIDADVTEVADSTNGGLADAGSDTGASDTSSPDTGVPDSGSPDTGSPSEVLNIREVLATCDDTARNPGQYPNQLTPGQAMSRMTLDYEDSRCNYGSPAVLYVRAATDPEHADDWIIHLQGGGNCFTYEQCETRWCGSDVYDASKMSSRWAPQRIGAHGVHHGDSNRNRFASWNHVFFYYCSSDGWQGRGMANLEGSEGDAYTMYRHGHLIIGRALETLRTGATSDDGQQEMPDISNVGRVMWSGTSAASGGARVNADWVREQLGPNVDFFTVLDAGINPAPEAYPEEVGERFYEAALSRRTLRLEQEEVAPFQDESCEQAAPEGEDYLCEMPHHHLAHHFTSKLFVRGDLRDAVSLRNLTSLGVTTEVYATGIREFLLDLEGSMAAGLEAADVPRRPSVYGPNCGQHVGLEINAWFFDGTVKDGDDNPVTFHDALWRWMMEDEDFTLVDEVQPVLSGCQPLNEDH